MKPESSEYYEFSAKMVAVSEFTKPDALIDFKRAFEQALNESNQKYR